MPKPRVCTACGMPAWDDDIAEEPYVCNRCLGLPDRPTSPAKPTSPTNKTDGPPPARRVVEAAVPPPPRPLRGSWQAVGRGYRYLCNALLVLFLGALLAAGVGVVESAYKFHPLPVRMSLCVLVLALTVAVVMRLIGAVAVASRPRRGRVKGLASAVRGFAFVPVVNVLVFPLLLAVYTQAVGRETGKRSVRRAGWILLGCAVVLVPPLAWVLTSLGFWGVGLLIVFLDPPTSRPRAPAPPAPPGGDDAAAYPLLFALAAGCVIWLGAYIVSMITLWGVAQALEQAPPADPTDSDSDTDRRNDELA